MSDTLIAPPNSVKGFYVPAGDKSFRSYRRNINGTGVIEGLKIFRAGTFKDSMGYQRTWEVEHLEQMLFHYRLLHDRGIFPNVPVREGHPELFGSGGSVIGYVQDVSRDNDFVVADLEITEPDAFGKWERGTYRARSLEVGMYETNDESAYWPVIMGLAFVDIPAVEGLYSKYSNPSRRPERSRHHFSQTVVENEKENTVADAPTNPEGTEGTPPAAPPVAPADPANPQQAPADGGTTTTPPAQAPNDGGGTTPPPNPAGDPNASNHAANSAQIRSFRINGSTVSDFAAVQAHIDTLEGFQRETREAARRDFVAGLARNNQIMATQVESMTNHALGLNDSQWDAFQAVYASAPPIGLFNAHNDSGNTNDPARDSAIDELSILEEQLAMHKRYGMSQENIEKTTAYKRLQALKSSGTAA